MSLSSSGGSSGLVILPGTQGGNIDYGKAPPRSILPENPQSRRLMIGLIIAGALSILFVLGGVVSASKEEGTMPTSAEEKQDDYHATSSALPPNVLAPPAPHVQEWCGITNSTEHGIWCAAECGKAECCNFPVTLGPSLSCLEGNEQVCSEYKQQCSTQFLASATTVESHVVGTAPTSQHIPPAPVDLSTTCALHQLESAPGYHACSHACLPAECCWAPGQASCAHFLKTASTCNTYAPCLHLQSVAHQHNDITEHVQEVCNATHVTTTAQGHGECQQVCRLAKCCFKSHYLRHSTSCPHNVTDFCQQYQACQILFDSSIPVVSATTP